MDSMKTDKIGIRTIFLALAGLIFGLGFAAGALFTSTGRKKCEFQTKVPVVPGLTITCGQDMTNCDTTYTYSEP